MQRDLKFKEAGVSRPEPLKDFVITDLGDGIYNITAPPMRFQQYLVLGAEKGLLVDSGFGLGSLRKVVNELTTLPILLINTHGHPDHGGGNAEFGSPLLHPADNELYAQKCAYETRFKELLEWGLEDRTDELQPTPPAPVAVNDGDTIDLGGRILTVIHTMGHTMGSICIFDLQTGALFAGDNLQAMTTQLTESCASSVSSYLDSMTKLLQYPITAIYTGHMPVKVPTQLIELKIRCAENIMAGDMGEYHEGPRGKGYTAYCQGTSICYDPDKIR